MKNNRIHFIGTTNNKSIRDIQPGECSHVVNLQRHNNTLLPIATYNLIGGTNSNRKICYIHSCNGEEHIISIEEKTLYHESDIINGYLTPINKELTTLENELCEIASLGNTLIVTTPTNITYITYRSNSYKVLGSKPPMPCIVFKEKVTAIYSYDTPEVVFDGCMEKLSDTDIEFFSNHIMGPLFKLRDEVHQACAFFEPVIIRYALRLFDGSHILPSPPVIVGLKNYLEMQKEHLLVLNYLKTTDTTKLLSDFITWDALGIEYIIGNTDLEDWRDIVAGIDIFVSKEISLLTNESVKNGTYYNKDNNKWEYIYKYKIPTYESSYIEEYVFNESLFYQLTTIELKDIIPNTAKLLEHKTNPTEIIYRPSLKVDTSGLATIGARRSFVYNNRIHLADITYSFFKGYEPMIFCTDFNMDNSNASICINTQISNIYGGTRVVSTYMSVPFFAYKLSPIISYPDNNASSMEILIRHNGYEYRKTFILKSCGSENRSTYVSPQALYIDVNEWEKTPINIDNLEDFPTPSTFAIEQHNRMIVSEMNNPFFFPDELSYYISNGTINGIASTTAALSQGQFGEFPLYIFTSEGIWSMQQGTGTTCYSRCTPINNEATHKNSLILPTDRAIIYLSGKDLSVLSGSQCKVLVTLSELKPHNFIKKLPNLVNNTCECLTDSTPILNYINDDISAIYNHKKKELIISNKKFSYSWILHIPSQHLYRWEQSLQSIIGNEDTLLMQHQNGIIYNLNDEIESLTDISLITHPIQCAPDMYARIRQFVWRMQSTYCLLSLYVLAAHEPDGTYKTIYHSTFEGGISGHLPLRIFSAPYKYYRLILSGTVSPDFTLDCADISYDIVENNKLR